MKNNITAEEFMIQKFSSIPTELEDIEDLMIEFAKLHVQEALKAAHKNSNLYLNPDTNEFEVDTFSILNAYPLSNIK